MPTCPHCHRILWYDEMDDESSDGRVMYQYWRGHCPDCSRHYKWTERYEFTDFYDLEEEKEYDHSYEEAEKEGL